jgi:CxxC motif-containing protein
MFSLRGKNLEGRERRTKEMQYRRRNTHRPDNRNVATRLDTDTLKGQLAPQTKMTTVEIFFSDLTEAKQEELLKAVSTPGKLEVNSPADMNWDTMPVAVLEFEPEIDSPCTVCKGTCKIKLVLSTGANVETCPHCEGSGFEPNEEKAKYTALCKNAKKTVEEYKAEEPISRKRYPHEKEGIADEIEEVIVSVPIKKSDLLQLAKDILESYPEYSESMVCTSWNYEKGEFVFVDAESEYNPEKGTFRKIYNITNQQVADALPKFFIEILTGKSKFAGMTTLENLMDAGQYDAYITDALIQKTALGEIIYG